MLDKNPESRIVVPEIKVRDCCWLRRLALEACGLLLGNVWLSPIHSTTPSWHLCLPMSWSLWAAGCHWEQGRVLMVVGAGGAVTISGAA